METMIAALDFLPSVSIASYEAELAVSTDPMVESSFGVHLYYFFPSLVSLTTSS